MGADICLEPPPKDKITCILEEHSRLMRELSVAQHELLEFKRLKDDVLHASNIFNVSHFNFLRPRTLNEFRHNIEKIKVDLTRIVTWMHEIIAGAKKIEFTKNLRDIRKKLSIIVKDPVEYYVDEIRRVFRVITHAPRRVVSDEQFRTERYVLRTVIRMK